MTAYLDCAASTPMRPEAIAAMQPFLAEHPGNPSGIHAAAREAKTALEDARDVVAAELGRHPAEIVFTGSGSEADNLAVKGAARAARAAGRGDGVVTTAIEHKAVLASVARLAAEGFRTATVGVDGQGVVDRADLAGALGERTVVVSVMTVNNEVGSVQPLADVAALVRERAPNAVLHTDAVQAPQWCDLRPIAAAADLVALSGHKFGGPKGVGVLAVRTGVALEPLVEGGGHEHELRAGTQNVAGIVAFAAALGATGRERERETTRIAALSDRLEAGLRARVPDLVVNVADAVPGILHVGVPGVEAETLLVLLDVEGVCAAAGSSCSSGATEPSPVLQAMGLPRDLGLSSLRLSLGWATTDAEVDHALAVIPTAVERLRAGVVAAP